LHPPNTPSRGAREAGVREVVVRKAIGDPGDRTKQNKIKINRDALT